MRIHVVASIILLLQCASPARADAQGLDGLRIIVGVSVGRSDGGDGRRSTAGFIYPDAIGKTQRFAFSRPTGVCGTGVRSEPVGDLGQASDAIAKGVSSAWVVQVTPTGHVGEAVTFRLQWKRTRDNGKASTVGDDTELTLRPGESLLLDVMPQSTDAAAVRGSCGLKSLSLGVSSRTPAGATPGSSLGRGGSLARGASPRRNGTQSTALPSRTI